MKDTEFILEQRKLSSHNFFFEYETEMMWTTKPDVKQIK